MQIPLPKSGYWPKIRVGKKVPVPQLSSDYKGESALSLRIGKKKQEEDLSPLGLLQKDIEEKHGKLLNVPAKLINPVKLIEAKKEAFDKQGKNKPYEWTLHRDTINLDVSGNLVGRGLRFMDTLIKLLQVRGHLVKQKERSIYTIVEGEEIFIRLREKQTRIENRDKEHRWEKDHKYVPSGLLVFSIDSYPTKEWCDGKQLIEQKLTNIAAYLELRGLEEKERKIRRKKEEEERQERMRIQREQEKLQEKELNRFKNLLIEAERWRKVKLLREYIADMKLKVTEDKADPLSEWIEWAEKKADWYDPQVRGNDELMDGIDKETLTLKNKSSYW
jgi:hypothetical protein